ncbi:putative nuclease HARBI1 isoform X2 [Diabrotica virgifera virgifera]|uniref:DDE Tnp4 domain-containing protein n=1 Tax=Diabrotica virgifera virgifera TaxID=50390 RepID=A0ABM5JZL9_DIAVI|nr:putative nuclease HARBI1 isoform X2 [Diabrotica virgifera virgifera]
MDDDDIIMLMLIDDVEEAAEQAENNIPRLYFQREDPFLMLSEVNFIKHFRLNKDSFIYLCDELTPFLQVRQRTSGLDIKTKLLVTLLFYGQGSYQAVTGSNFFCGMSQSSVCRCIEEVTNALNRPEFISRWISFPRNIEELSQRRARFFQSTGIPGGIGIIDCTHVALVRPIQEEHIFVNRKNYHSLNVQLVCDEHLQVMNVNANFPGSTHDAYIWGQSNISNVLERVYRREPQNNFFCLAIRAILYDLGC